MYSIVESGEPSSRPITGIFLELSKFNHVLGNLVACWGVKVLGTCVCVGTLCIGGVECHVLFDTGASHCFVTPELAEKANVRSEPGVSLGFVEVAGGKLLMIHGRVRDVDVQVAGESMPADLIICSVELYDVILGMDWLGKFRAYLDCHRGRVEFDRGKGKLVYQGVRPTSGSLTISVMQAVRMIERGCEAYLATISLPEAVGEAKVQDI